MPWWSALYRPLLAFPPGLTPWVLYWLVAAVVGLAFKVANVRAAVYRARQVRPEDGPVARAVATVDLAAQAVMLFVLVIAVLAGLGASFTRAAVPADPLRSLIVFGLLESLVTAIACHAGLVWLGHRMTTQAVRAAR